MKGLVTLILFAVLVSGFSLAGCGGSDEDATSVRTMDEYREEAAEEIDADSAEAELEELTREIEKDITEGQ